MANQDYSRVTMICKNTSCTNYSSIQKTCKLVEISIIRIGVEEFSFNCVNHQPGIIQTLKELEKGNCLYIMPGPRSLKKLKALHDTTGYGVKACSDLCWKAETEMTLVMTDLNTVEMLDAIGILSKAGFTVFNQIK